MKIDVAECGACVGCEIKAAVLRYMTEIDEFFSPRMIAAGDALARCMEMERGMPKELRYETEDAHAALRALRARRESMVSVMMRTMGAFGCIAPTITLTPESAGRVEQDGSPCQA